MKKLSKIDESAWGDMRRRSTGGIIRKEDMVKTNEELREIIDNLYEKQGRGEILDVSSIALGKKIICDDLSSLFENYTDITRIIGLETWNVSSATNMSYMFYRCKNLTELNIGNWDVSNVTDMRHIFDCCKNLTELNIDNWDVSNVTYVIDMFNHCKNLTELNIDNWDVSKFIDIDGMFFDCGKLNKKPIWYKSISW